jgi:hypothetical protein
MRGLAGAVMAIGLLVGCGGVEADMDSSTLNHQEQAAYPSCPEGYEEFQQWDCQYRGCGTRDRDVLNLYCCSV